MYYDLMGTLPGNLESVKAGNAMENDFDIRRDILLKYNEPSQLYK